MGASANAAGFLYMRNDRRLREWQDEVDNHYPRLRIPAPRPREGGVRVTYRARASAAEWAGRSRRPARP